MTDNPNLREGKIEKVFGILRKKRVKVENVRGRKFQRLWE